jgi:hypothetical protein
MSPIHAGALRIVELVGPSTYCFQPHNYVPFPVVAPQKFVDFRLVVFAYLFPGL